VPIAKDNVMRAPVVDEKAPKRANRRANLAAVDRSQVLAARLQAARGEQSRQDDATAIAEYEEEIALEGVFGNRHRPL
jgi:hypothetical protein